MSFAKFFAKNTFFAEHVLTTASQVKVILFPLLTWPNILDVPKKLQCYVDQTKTDCLENIYSETLMKLNSF